MKVALTFCLAIVLAAGSLFAGETKVNLEVGDEAPAFEAQDDQGQTFKSSEYIGKKILVVYFYPADMTPGCTKQACAFRDDMERLEGADVKVVGVSGDSVENHKLFKKAEKLNFTLLADPEGKVAKKFGVPMRDGGSIKRTVDGKEYTLTRGVTTSRWTFVIDQEGEIVLKNTKVDAANDSKAVIKAVKELQSDS